ncbi:MAG: esterase-like activity of phytase family protein [Phycisphaerales bacterium]
MHRTRLIAATASALLAGPATIATAGDEFASFERIASFPVFLNSDIDVETVAEIVATSADGMTLVYTDAKTQSLGFVDITDPAAPVAGGSRVLAGEPTSVGIVGDFALVAVNTSPDFVNPSGTLEVIDLMTRATVRSIDLGGQPDAVAVSPDGQYAAIAIENERDEDLGNGEPPQMPAGFLTIVDLNGSPASWAVRTVDLTGIADRFPEDPEPEYVDINAGNQCVVTLQENNHLIVVDLPTGDIVTDFSAGSVNLTLVDTNENDLIEQTASLRAVPREPDAVAWVSQTQFATADEGDLTGGSRGFTVFNLDGTTSFEAGNSIEHLAASLGHYPENRSENKGTEPEGVDFARYGNDDVLFVGLERANLVLVYRIDAAGSAIFVQALPAGVGPEGLLAIPSRNLLVVASEVDDRGDGLRSALSIYQRSGVSAYPDLASVTDAETGVPIPWAALSGMTIDPNADDAGLMVHDSFYAASRFYAVDLGRCPARITADVPIRDANGVLAAALSELEASLTDPGVFTVREIVTADDHVNLDLEGISATRSGDVWVVSEGSGNFIDGASDPDRPFASPNMLLRLAPDGTILSAVLPPLDLTRNQLRFGFEGVAADAAAGSIYVAWQRAWTGAGDPDNHVRIGRYTTSTASWSFAYYPIDEPTSPNGGWVGLGDLALDAAGRLLVLERDNQGGTDARIKRIATVDPNAVTFASANADPSAIPVLQKQLLRDLIAADDYARFGGFVPEKLEGLAIDSTGRVRVVNDNDGVDDNNGETRILDLGPIGSVVVADIDGDGTVNFLDLLTIIAAFGPCTGECPADLDGDGVVDANDLLVVLSSFGAGQG